jgi:hypothetical protein
MKDYVIIQLGGKASSMYLAKYFFPLFTLLLLSVLLKIIKRCITIKQNKEFLLGSM